MKDKFLRHLKFEKRVSENTIKSYDNDLSQFLTFSEKYENNRKLSSIDNKTIRAWIIELSTKNLSNKSINRKIASIKSFFKFLIKRQIIKKNPSTLVKSLKAKQKLPLFLKEKDLVGLFKTINLSNTLDETRSDLILELLYGTGIRINELINLKSKNLDLIRNEIKVLGKRNKERILPINQNIVSKAKLYLNHKKRKSSKSEFVFLTDKGNKLYPMMVYRIVKKCLSSLINSEKYNPHLLRHSFATHILNKGGDLNAIKDLLGHESLAATQIYTHNSIEKLKETHKKSHPRAN
ncbi:MAG: integrase [Flammeovirgaceae bacterium]|mgnify:FL=1|nr:integrase [Flammeovirgaceae bacterium]|tara:strand:+ start:870 stop:1748 length:879 start_codon:yes stop_codon:yes gene_type:complete